jgi:hypothetical protein
VNGVATRSTKGTNGVITNGSKGSSSKGGDSKDSASGSRNGSVEARGSPTVVLWQGLVWLGSLLLGEAPVPVAAR